MIELLNRYKDLGVIPESLLLIDKYKNLFKELEILNKYNNDNYKQYQYK